jgi:TRAP-type C4-dicarboxylate transport system substrate-binding protein
MAVVLAVTTFLRDIAARGGPDLHAQNRQRHAQRRPARMAEALGGAGREAGGRIKVEIYPASQIGSIPRMIEGLRLGTLEAWIGSPELVVHVRKSQLALTGPNHHMHNFTR